MFVHDFFVRTLKIIFLSLADSGGGVQDMAIPTPGGGGWDGRLQPGGRSSQSQHFLAPTHRQHQSPEALLWDSYSTFLRRG